MNKMLPKASKKSLEELLKFLGPRAEDFKKCFDTESDWCLMYADLMMRNVNDTRKHEYKEGHHVIPACYYGTRSRSIDKGNLIALPYGEHLYSHYCAANCAIGRMKHKMARAFSTMYSIAVGKKRPLFPTDEELIAAIPELEAKRILGMTKRVAKVESEGRTHRWEDPVQAWKDYYNMNKEKLSKKAKEYREKNKERLKLQNKKYREENPEHIKALRKASYARNREKNLARSKEYRLAHIEEKREYDRKYREANVEHKKAIDRAYYTVHAEEIKARENARRANYTDADKERVKGYREKRRDKKAAYDKIYVAANKERLSTNWKKYREGHREQHRAYNRAWKAAKRAAGYRIRIDPVTKKEKWVFVGNPATPETPKTSMDAA